MNQNTECSTMLALQNTVGWHLRPAGLLVGVATMFESEIMVRCGRRIASAKSLLGILTLGAGRNARLYVSARGHDAQMAIKAIKDRFAPERLELECIGDGQIKCGSLSPKCSSANGRVATSFKLSTRPGVSTVCLAGDFNEWDPNADPMNRRGGLFIKCLKLVPGQYQYKFVVDGDWHVDPAAPFAVSDLGTINNVIHVQAL